LGMQFELSDSLFLFLTVIQQSIQETDNLELVFLKAGIPPN